MSHRFVSSLHIFFVFFFSLFFWFEFALRSIYCFLFWFCGEQWVRETWWLLFHIPFMRCAVLVITKTTSYTFTCITHMKQQRQQFCQLMLKSTKPNQIPQRKKWRSNFNHESSSTSLSGFTVSKTISAITTTITTTKAETTLQTIVVTTTAMRYCMSRDDVRNSTLVTILTIVLKMTIDLHCSPFNRYSNKSF